MKKKQPNLVTNFTDQRDILDYRPNIVFIEPDKINETHTPKQIQPVASSDVTDLLIDYDYLIETADVVQESINLRCNNLVVNLDPVQDSHVIEAVRRFFGDPKKTTITFGEYIECVDTLNKESEKNINTPTQAQICEGVLNPNKDTFGGLGRLPGMARPELESINQPIKPINLDTFKNNSIADLFKALEPFLTAFLKPLIPGM